MCITTSWGVGLLVPATAAHWKSVKPMKGFGCSIRVNEYRWASVYVFLLWTFWDPLMKAMLPSTIDISKPHRVALSFYLDHGDTERQQSGIRPKHAIFCVNLCNDFWGMEMSLNRFWSHILWCCFFFSRQSLLQILLIFCGVAVMALLSAIVDWTRR